MAAASIPSDPDIVVVLLLGPANSATCFLNRPSVRHNTIRTHVRHPENPHFSP
jgi:hypothetical protein